MKKKLDLGWVRTYDKREYAAVLDSNTLTTPFFFFVYFIHLSTRLTVTSCTNVVNKLLIKK